MVHGWIVCNDLLGVVVALSPKGEGGATSFFGA